MQKVYRVKDDVMRDIMDGNREPPITVDEMRGVYKYHGTVNMEDNEDDATMDIMDLRGLDVVVDVDGVGYLFDAIANKFMALGVWNAETV